MINKVKVLKPYIGVTDFTTRAQVEEAKAFIHKDSGRVLHVGAMRSYKTHKRIPTKPGWEKIWLVPEQLQDLFIPDDNVFNVLHWADFGKDHLTTTKELIEACAICGVGLDGLQLDMVWPNVAMLQVFKEVRPDITVILQVSKDAMNVSQTNGKTFIEDLAPYVDLVDFVLLDYGVGRGTPFIAETLLKSIKETVTLFPENRIVVGGGLGPQTFYSLEPILQRFPLISWDAQGQMRSSSNAVDPIEMNRVTAYLRGSSTLAAKYMKK